MRCNCSGGWVEVGYNPSLHCSMYWCYWWLRLVVGTVLGGARGILSMRHSSNEGSFGWCLLACGPRTEEHQRPLVQSELSILLGQGGHWLCVQCLLNLSSFPVISGCWWVLPLRLDDNPPLCLKIQWCSGDIWWSICSDKNSKDRADLAMFRMIDISYKVAGGWSTSEFLDIAITFRLHINYHEYRFKGIVRY